MGMTKTSAAAVANFILDKGRECQVPVRQLKLQKITYFAYAWYAGNNLGKLFDEDIEAWPLGPVIRDLYIQFRDCGSHPISQRATTIDSNFEAVTPTAPEDVRVFLNLIWDSYGSRSDAWLVDATHKEGEPWEVFVKKIGSANKRAIPHDLIEKIYKEKVQAA
jgi:uncharacterized phage-associated protein